MKLTTSHKWLAYDAALDSNSKDPTRSKPLTSNADIMTIYTSVVNERTRCRADGGDIDSYNTYNTTRSYASNSNVFTGAIITMKLIVYSCSISVDTKLGDVSFTASDVT